MHSDPKNPTPFYMPTYREHRTDGFLTFLPSWSRFFLIFSMHRWDLKPTLWHEDIPALKLGPNIESFCPFSRTHVRTKPSKITTFHEKSLKIHSFWALKNTSGYPIKKFFSSTPFPCLNKRFSCKKFWISKIGHGAKRICLNFRNRFFAYKS